MQIIQGGTTFEWDDNKDAINRQKHKLSFKTAIKVFLDYNRIERYDEEHSYDEDRFITIGMVGEAPVIIQAVYTERKDSIRIISARKATTEERREYYDC